MPTTDELLDRFDREYVAYNQISPGRAREQRKLLLEFGVRLGRPLSAAGRDDLQSFAGELLAAGLHVNTVRKKLNLIRPFYSWAYAAQVIGGDQYMALKSVKDPRGATNVSLPNPYRPEQLDELRAKLQETFPLKPEHGPGSLALQRWLTGKSPWQHVLYRHGMRLQVEAVVALALHLGLRRSEIFGLSVDELHYDLRFIIVLGKREDHRDKPREVPFTTEARTAVKNWLEFRALLRLEHDRPWVSVRRMFLGKPWSRTRFAVLLRDTLGDGWELHRLRHTCGTEWVRAGADLKDVSRLLGHANLQQTLGYAEIVANDVERSMQKHEAAFMERIQNRAA